VTHYDVPAREQYPPRAKGTVELQVFPGLAAPRFLRGAQPQGSCCWHSDSRGLALFATAAEEHGSYAANGNKRALAAPRMVRRRKPVSPLQVAQHALPKRNSSIASSTKPLFGFVAATRALLRGSLRESHLDIEREEERMTSRLRSRKNLLHTLLTLTMFGQLACKEKIDDIHVVRDAPTSGAEGSVHRHTFRVTRAAKRGAFLDCRTYKESQPWISIATRAR
jgi:hypothetical protein